MAALKVKPPRRGPVLPRDRGSSVRSVSIRGTEEPRPQGLGDRGVDPPRMKLAHPLVARRPEKAHRATAAVPAVGDGAPRGRLAISRSVFAG